MRIAFGILAAVGAFAPGRASAEIVEIHQRVFGMDCLPCSQAVHATISRIGGVVSVEVSMRRGGADIRLAPGNTVSIAQLRAAIRKAGYEPKEARLRARGDLVVDHGELVLNLSGQAPLRVEANPRGGPLPCRPGKDVLVEGTIEAGKDQGPMLVNPAGCDVQAEPDAGRTSSFTPRTSWGTKSPVTVNSREFVIHDDPAEATVAIDGSSIS